MSLSRDRDHATPTTLPVDTPSGGRWGKVTAVVGDAVKVSIATFDQGEAYFGPVPFIGETPAVGLKCFVHFDQAEQAAYAVIFP